MGAPTYRRFTMHRDTDASGVSGIGVVAEGVCFDDAMTVTFPNGEVCELPPGFCVIRWGGTSGKGGGRAHDRN